MRTDRPVERETFVDQPSDHHVVEIRLTYRYTQAHAWVVPAITGFF